jgi:hypothetical protein
MSGRKSLVKVETNQNQWGGRTWFAPFQFRQDDGLRQSALRLGVCERAMGTEPFVPSVEFGAVPDRRPAVPVRATTYLI